MPLLLLFHRLVVRPLLREPLRTTLTVVAVMLGVAVAVAIEVAGNAAAGSFRSSLETLTGKADLEVSAAGGLPDSLAARLAQLPFPLEVTPRLEAFATVTSTQATVPVLGLDLLAEAARLGTGELPPGDITTARPVWAGKRLGAAGQTLTLILNDRQETVQIQGVLAGDEAADVIVMDIALAQEWMGKAGKLDRLEIKLPEGADVAQWIPVLRQELPTGALLQPRGSRTEENRKMLAAFRWNLRVLSYISLVVGAFLIYNTIAVSVVRRRAEIGIVRALGATRGMVLAAFLAEAACFGFIGWLGGLVLGRVLAAAAVEFVGATVESLYVSSRPGPLELTGVTITTALILALGVCLLAALAPALEAAAVAPTEAMARGREHYLARLHLWRNLAAALLLLAAAWASASAPPIAGWPLFGYLAAALLIAAAALSVPAAIALLARAWPWVVRRTLGVESTLAAKGMVASLRRTAVLVGALATAVGMITSVGIMVGSFRETVLHWLDDQLRADFFLRPAGAPAADRFPTLSPDLANQIERVPGVAAVDRFRIYPLSFRGRPVTLAGGETHIVERFGSTGFLPGPRAQDVFAGLRSGQGVIVSEPFAHKFSIAVGDELPLALGGRELQLRVLGIYYDYSNERGTIVMDRRTLLQALPDPAPSSLAVYVRPGADEEAVRREMERLSAGRAVLILSHRALRTDAIRVFDRTFAITYGLEAVAIVVAVLGVTGALLALVIDRRRELGLLRFLGASVGQIRKMLLWEAGLLGLLANVVGFALGTALSLVLIFVINKQSFGWTIQIHWPVQVLLGGLTVVHLATVGAGLYPARIAMRLDPLEALHEE